MHTSFLLRYFVNSFITLLLLNSDLASLSYTFAGTLPDKNLNIVLPYPSGFTEYNSIITGFMIKKSDEWISCFSQNTSNCFISVNLTSAGVKVGVSSASAFYSLPYHITLHKI